MKTYGYAIKGWTPHSRRILVRGTRISVIAAIACDGLVAMECTTVTISSNNFFDFVRGTLFLNTCSYIIILPDDLT